VSGRCARQHTRRARRARLPAATAAPKRHRVAWVPGQPGDRSLAAAPLPGGSATDVGAPMIHQAARRLAQPRGGPPSSAPAAWRPTIQRHPTAPPPPPDGRADTTIAVLVGKVADPTPTGVSAYILAQVARVHAPGPSL